MLDRIKGSLVQIKEKILYVNIGFATVTLLTPNATSCQLGNVIEIYTYLHWNQETGPSLYGFIEEKERSMFLLLIECPKIGPSIAITILTQITPERIIDLVTTNNIVGLSKLNGIGTKKAELIVIELKNKIQKIIIENPALVSNTDGRLLNELSDVLLSLNYTKQEVAKAINHVNDKKEFGKNIDHLIRISLAYLSQQKQT